MKTRRAVVCLCIFVGSLATCMSEEVVTQDVPRAGTGAVAVAVATNAVPADYPPLPKPGRKIPLGTERHFTYGFAESPKLGTSIMRVEVFTNAGKRDTSFVVKGEVDMPSMRGAHSSGEKDFALSNKGVYLMPARLVMPGAWEVRFTFVKDGKTVLRGAYHFEL